MKGGKRMKKSSLKFIFAFMLLIFSVSSAFAVSDTALEALSDFLDGKSPTEITLGIVKNLAQDFLVDTFLDWWNSDPNTTALFKAVVEPKTKPQEIRDLVAKGAEINARYKKGGYTPLMYAALVTSDPDVISTLIELGANVNEKDDSNFTALIYAVLKNTNPEITATLIRSGADVSLFNKKEDDSDMTIFGEMMWDDETTPSPKVIRELLRGGVDVNSSRNHHGLTILMHEVARKNPNIEIIKELISGGADVNARDKDDETALMWALSTLRYNDTPDPEVTIKIIKELISGGTDVNAKDEDGKTVLMKTDNPEIIRELIKAGANVNLQDEDDWTALMYAAKNSTPDVVETLLSAGADTGIKGDDWFIFSVTALDLAKDRLEDKDNTDKRAAQEIVELLNTQQGFFSRIWDNISRFFGGIFRFIVKWLLILGIGGGIIYWMSNR